MAGGLGDELIRIDTDRAVSLLEDFSSRILSDGSKQLKINIDRIIRGFKSHLFQALLDIYEYYFHTLTNDSIISERIAGKENCQEVQVNLMRRPTPEIEDDDIVLRVIIQRSTHGLGFSIAGGTDNYNRIYGNNIFISKVLIDGPAIEYLRKGDIILAVNEYLIQNSSQYEAAEILKSAGEKVNLLISRSQYKNIKVIDLKKGRNGFGFSIIGGVTEAGMSMDTGIYITKIESSCSASENGHLLVGDRIIAVWNRDPISDVRSFMNVDHDEAVRVFRSSQHISLFVVELESK